MLTILAVAVGDTASGSPKTINSNGNSLPAGVRPYIRGLITGLSNYQTTYTIGTDYTINYWELPASKLDNFFVSNSPAHADPDAVFCMSTSVMISAVKKYGGNINIPIIGIVSDYSSYNQTNVGGLSAKRFQTADSLYFKFFQTMPSELTGVHLLHQPGYPPSISGYTKIANSLPKGSKPKYVDVTEGKDIIAGLQGEKIQQGEGILVLPIDRCFGRANDINFWAYTNKIPVFWPVTDWVDPSNVAAGSYPAFGGYGLDQESCGEKMANKLGYYWHNTSMPPKPFDDCDTRLVADGGDFSWRANKSVVKQLAITLSSDTDLTQV